MFGGPPMSFQPQFAVPYNNPRPVYPQQRPQQAPAYAAQPQPAPMYAAQPQPAPPSQPLPRPIFRAQAPDEPVFRPPVAPQQTVAMSLPSPEALGLGVTRTALAPPEAMGIAVQQSSGDHIDWTVAHRRLDRLGATCFQKDRVAGGWRMTCLLPTSQTNRSRRVEAQAASESEALRLMFEQAEK